MLRYKLYGDVTMLICHLFCRYFFHILSWKKKLTTILFFKATTKSFATEESMKEIEVIYTFDTMRASIANRPFGNININK